MKRRSIPSFNLLLGAVGVLLTSIVAAVPALHLDPLVAAPMIVTGLLFAGAITWLRERRQAVAEEQIATRTISRFSESIRTRGRRRSPSSESRNLSPRVRRRRPQPNGSGRFGRRGTGQPASRPTRVRRAPGRPGASRCTPRFPVRRHRGEVEGWQDPRDGRGIGRRVPGLSDPPPRAAR